MASVFRSLVGILLALGAIPACSGSLDPDQTRQVAGLVAIAGDGQAGTVAEVLAAPLTVRAMSASGERLPGVTVTWSVADGAGQPQPPVSVTDSQGQATTAWRLGTAPGLQVLRAEASPAPPVTFQASATASSADRASLTPRAVTLDALGETARFSVEAFDRYDNPLSAVPVAWSVSNSAVARVDDVGLVTALANGTSRLRVDVGDLQDSALVTVAQRPASLELSAPEDTLQIGQVMQIRSTLKDRLGSRIERENLEWASSDPGVVTVDGTGQVLAVGPGTTLVTAAAQSAEATLSITVIPEEPGTPPPVERIIEVGGDDQRGVVAERLSEPLVVRTISADGEALSGVTVTWSIEAGGGKAEPASSVSDAEGVATTVWRLGTAAGRHALVAEANPAPPITFEAIATAGPPEDATLSAGKADFDALGDTVRFAITVFDRYDNRIPSPGIVWSISDPAVAGVDDTGLVTALANGSTWLSIAVGEVSDSVPVNVSQRPFSLELVTPEDTLRGVGATMRIEAEVKDRLGSLVPAVQVDWISGDADVVTVDEAGNVVAVGSGSTLVTAAVDQVEAAVRVTVVAGSTEPLPPASLEITPDFISIVAGRTGRLESRYLDAEGRPVPGGPVTWRSLAPEVAALVDRSSGVLIGKRQGTTLITASGSGLADSAAVVVVEPGSGVKGRILSGNDQTGGAGTELPLALTLQIEDENGTPVPDQIINWVVVQGGGSMYLETTVTGPAGTTQNFWILGTPGAQVVEARAVNSTSGAAITFAVFRATAE